MHSIQKFGNTTIWIFLQNARNISTTKNDLNQEAYKNKFFVIEIY